ncbi:helix-turn-helix domain-containing protein [Micromonospora endophytica]|uniref:Transcriptional regulator n=1 Tax=Micromonospora endophytica TaxID=515350 RepID=A0A2W2CN27_9ACTN|nr:helix-turn-helix transcriptional regulator [Micromonospora endophytica]PZF93068.1 transcriptional regulator [Micromonospora endophytica]RIW45667.1 XRE family transcriptional regulator [Micromonospora endophytica]BCJ58885.1 transcriptional regulator [Micromonospora endophytica]
MDAKRQLGEFLYTRRSQLRPADVGLATYPGRRRVAGLRREELALLAGVSSSYYARLEQGQSSNASAEVLDAIATALRLDEAERRHLHDLATGSRRRAGGRRVAPERVSPAVRQLITALGDVPVLVLGRRSDVLAWNRAGNALFAGHLEFTSPQQPQTRPNMARLVFLDPHTRELYGDWPEKARAVVGTLRLSSGQYPDDPALAVLIGELSVRSPEFSHMWADHRVKSGGEPVYEMRHPLVGAMSVTQQSLRTEQGQHLVVATTEPGSPSQAAMTLLVHSVVTARTAPADGATTIHAPTAR